MKGRPIFINTWSASLARYHFSTLLRMINKGPQFIEVHGKPAAVVISQEEYEEFKPASWPLRGKK